MEKNVNLSIQVVPVNVSDSYSIVDKAIEVIQSKNIKYEVGPFSTSVEGPYSELMELIEEMKTASFEAGADELLLNIQIHAKKDKDVTFESKVQKFRD